MSGTMQAVVVDGKGGIDIQELPVPRAGVGEVVIRPRATGVCGTDLHLIEGSYEHGRYPVVPGHEFAGDIVEVGPAVTEFAEGDFVGVDPNISCGQCRWCKSGATNLCVSLRPVGINFNGSCADLVVVPTTVVHPLSDTLDGTTGALVEPLSCVLHAVERAPDWADSHMVVFGAGPIGLLTIALAKHLGSGPIDVIEPHAIRRDLAVQMGARKSAVSLSQLGLNREGVDLAVDASGHPAAIQQALEILGRRGRLIQMGVAHEEARVSLSPYQVFAKEISIIGSQSLATSYPAAADLMVDMAETLRPLVTHQLPLSQYAQAVSQAKSPEAIKVQVVPD